MKSKLTRAIFTKLNFIVIIFATIFFASAANLLADEVFIAGFTNGCYGAGCAPGATATSGGLTYSNATFSGTTANGFRGIGGNANPGSNFNNLGSISLSTAPQSYNTPFSLQVTFTAPQGITGSNQTTLTATISGTVRSDNTGGVFIDFNNTPVVFTFKDTNCEPNPEAQPPSAGQTTCGNGSFSLSVNDIAIDPGQTVSVTGQITSAQQSTTTAATVSISGRVMTPASRGITGVQLSLTDSAGNIRTATTNSFGYYQFDDVEVGETYILAATGKHYTFSQSVQVLNVNQDANQIDFIADSEKRLRVF